MRALAPDEIDVAAIGELFQLVYADRQGAGLAFWLSFAGWRSDGAGMLQPVVERIHAARVRAAERAGLPAPVRHPICRRAPQRDLPASRAFGDTQLASVTDQAQLLSPSAFLGFAGALAASRLVS
ncbi:MAG TPA: hypothetical protein VGI95_03700 [Caulobacteraceae bacterium]